MRTIRLPRNQSPLQRLLFWSLLSSLLSSLFSLLSSLFSLLSSLFSLLSSLFSLITTTASEDQVSYNEQTTFAFEPELSGGSEEDEITNLWIPYFVATQTAHGELGLSIGAMQATIAQFVGLYQTLKMATNSSLSPLQAMQATADQWGQLTGDADLGIERGQSFVVSK